MTDRDAFPFDQVLARSRNIQQQIHQVVLEQVHLVDVEEAAMRPRQQAGLEGLHAFGQGALDVEGAGDAVLGGAKRQVHHRHGRLHRPQPPSRATVGAQRGGIAGIAAEAAALHHLHRRQQPREGAHGGGLACAAVAQNQHAADAAINRSDQEGAQHLLLAHDRGEGIGRASGRRGAGRPARPAARRCRAGWCTPLPHAVGRGLVHQAARRRRKRDHTVSSARTRWSMSASECTGEGVIRSRSVPRGTVG